MVVFVAVDVEDTRNFAHFVAPGVTNHEISGPNMVFSLETIHVRGSEFAISRADGVDALETDQAWFFGKILGFIDALVSSCADVVVVVVVPSEGDCRWFKFCQEVMEADA